MKKTMLVLMFVSVVFTDGCMRDVVIRKMVSISQQKEAQGKFSYHPKQSMKVHMKDGDVYLVHSWKFIDSTSSLEAGGAHLDINREPLGSGSFRIAYESIALLEVDSMTSRTTPAAGLAFVAGASVALSVYCLTNPKACFGSCPTFYVWDGKTMVLQAEGFSSSIAPALAATDIDALPAAKVERGALRMEVKNEALETHVIRRMRLVAAKRPRGGRVVKTDSGEFCGATGLIPPEVFMTEQGDRSALVSEDDGKEYFSHADSADLAAREVVDVEFGSIPPGSTGIIIQARQTLMTTFLLYQTLAYMGSSTGYWLSMLERGTDAKECLGQTAELLGRIEVMVQDESGRWVVAGEVGETGPIASDITGLRLPGISSGHIRLRMTKGFWRIGYVALASFSKETEPVYLDPVAVVSLGNDEIPVGTTWDMSARPLILLPGDVYAMSFEIPPGYEDAELFMESEGYYLEWMREQWIREENPDRFAEFLLDPEEYLRSLAPAYVAQEKSMDEQFWNSRYEKVP